MSINTLKLTGYGDTHASGRICKEVHAGASMDRPSPMRGFRGHCARECAVLQVLQWIERSAVDTDLKQEMRARAEPRSAHVAD
jgi:hypothetical protein